MNAPRTRFGIWRRAVAAAGISLGTAAGCERPVAPAPNGAEPAIVAARSPVAALDVGRFITDDRLAADRTGGCAHGQIFNQRERSTVGLRVLATRLPDGSLVRMRGVVGAVDERGSYIELVRDWPRGIGMRIGSYDTTIDTVWVLRYGQSGGRRATDERAVSDPEAASSLAALRRQFSALACPATLNRKLNLGALVPLWESRTRDGWEWRTEFPPRPRVGRSTPSR